LLSLLRERHKKAEKAWTCECCGTKLKIYEHKLDAGKVAALTKIYRASKKRWVKVPELVRRGVCRTDLGYGKLDLWGLTERHPTKDGYWRVTELGRSFLRGEAKVPRRAIILTPQKRLQHLEGEMIDVHEALAGKYDLDELLSWEVGS
jgi:hypothetical protein